MLTYYTMFVNNLNYRHYSDERGPQIFSSRVHVTGPDVDQYSI